MKIEVGKSYITRGGEVVVITGLWSDYPFVSDENRHYAADGKYLIGHETDQDLIAEVEQGAPGEITVKVPAGTRVGIEYLPSVGQIDTDDHVKIKREGGWETSGHALELERARQRNGEQP